MKTKSSKSNPQTAGIAAEISKLEALLARNAKIGFVPATDHPVWARLRGLRVILAGGAPQADLTSRYLDSPRGAYARTI